MITGLNHVNLRAPAALLDTLRDFYRDVLGFEVGHRPAFNSSGYWLYAGGQPVLHLSRQRDGEAPRLALDGPSPHTFDHVAWTASDPARSAARLREHHVPFHEERSPAAMQHQFFFTDPAGNGVELNFPWVDFDAR
jgi:catechol 2,3-dioxygenase-like lactoylglutathione lyase family enzyme